MQKAEFTKAFKDIVSRYPALQALSNQQIIEAIASHHGWAMEAMAHKQERAKQDMLLSTAVNRSSVLAHASDRQYIPRRPISSTGIIRIDNKSAVQIGLPIRSVFVSDDQVYYALDNAVTVDANSSTLTPVSQLQREIIRFTVSAEDPYLEFELSADQSKRLAKYSVYVDEGQGAIAWKLSHRFRNSSAGDRVYDEFYSNIDQFGIRFGNGSFGKIPTIGSTVSIEAFFTDGDTYLAPSSQLYPVSDIELADVEFFSGSAISGGSDREGTEETRRNALYYYLFDDQIAWKEDYEFALKQAFPSITWIKTWGEQEQEVRTGARTVDQINKIYFSAYDPSGTATDAAILSTLQGLKMVNRRFEIVPRVDAAFIINITGKLKVDVATYKATAAIQDKLTYYYGKDSVSRRDKCLLQDVYSILNGLGVFAPATLSVTIEGKTEATDLPEMVFLDLTTTINRLALSY